MKEFLKDTLMLDKFLEYDLYLKNEQILKKEAQLPTKLKFRKPLFLDKQTRIKDSKQFTSLDRIRIVVESLSEGVYLEELCVKEGISEKTYFEWKKDFLNAFNLYSEDVLIKEKLNLTVKELILRDTSIEVFNFFNKYIDDHTGNSLVVPKGETLSTYSNFSSIRNIVVLNKINNFRQINKHLEQVNSKLPNEGYLMGCFETFRSRSKNKSIYKVPILKHFYFAFEFIFKRVFPKLPLLKKIYFNVTKGKNRLLSRAESLGRLVSCGFKILEYKNIDGIHYFVATKIKEPFFDMSPSYGPLFKMKRVGKNGKIIGVYKFRTMHPYSEYLQDYILNLNGYDVTGKPADDFRLVPWGKILRRYWLDELPQLINVLKGELKLVGCRPVSERYFQDIPEEIQKMRITQKPGCIPPYVALNRISSVEEVLNAEKEYLEEKIRNPYTTDIKYFFNALYNIIIKNKRSA